MLHKKNEILFQPTGIYNCVQKAIVFWFLSAIETRLRWKNCERFPEQEGMKVECKY